MPKVIKHKTLQIRRGAGFSQKWKYKAGGQPVQNLSSLNPTFVLKPSSGSEIVCNIANGKLVVTDLTAEMEIVLTAAETAGYSWNEGRWYFFLQPSGQDKMFKWSDPIEVLDLDE